MTDQTAYGSSEPTSKPVDTERPGAARICDYLLGGASNFATDREIAQRLIDLDPRTPLYAHAHRRFLRWAVQTIAAAGVEQFVDIGPGVRAVGCVHETAQAINPQARTVYVDTDPVTVELWRTRLVDDPFSTAIHGDLRNPQVVLTHPVAQNLINTDRPVAVVITSALHFIPAADDPSRIVKEIGTSLATGSYLAVSHATPPTDPDDAWTAELLAAYGKTGTPLTLRTADEVATLFDGWELVRPVTALDEWLEPQIPVPGVAALGRLP